MIDDPILPGLTGGTEAETKTWGITVDRPCVGAQVEVALVEESDPCWGWVGPTGASSVLPAVESGTGCYISTACYQHDGRNGLRGGNPVPLQFPDVLWFSVFHRHDVGDDRYYPNKP